MCEQRKIHEQKFDKAHIPGKSIKRRKAKAAHSGSIKNAQVQK